MFASVCVLSYERPELLKECLASMLTRAEADFELIVHDDGSRDPELRRWLLSLADDGTISTLILNSAGHNEGQGVAMNRMAAIAKGDPIIKCDQDLVFEPGWLRRVQEVLTENNAPALVNESWSGCVHGACPKPEPCYRDCEDRPPLIGALGIFQYHHEPVRWEDMLIADHGTWEEHRDFVGSFIAIPRAAWELFGPWQERRPDFSEDNTFKLEVAATEGWCCALTKEELAVNQGFGIGPSTVVVADGQVAEIKDGTKLYRLDGV
jgi:glycosyltransferase involved in cell wall biosynthesis